MGHHYVPQRYLWGFQSPEKEKWIWTYDKQTRQASLLPAKRVAQVGNYYDDEVENELNTKVELPGNDVIDKIRSGGAIDSTDRTHLAKYIAVMILRVPRKRQLAESFAPEAKASIANETRSIFQGAADHGEIDQMKLSAKLGEIEAWEDKYSAAHPPQVNAAIRSPWPTDKVLRAVHSMNWSIVSSEGPSYFITSDNPAFFVPRLGIAHQESDLTFPLCSNLALYCSRNEHKGLNGRVISEKMVKEINRRTGSGAVRFAFYHQQADWVLSTASKDAEQFDPIQW